MTHDQAQQLLSDYALNALPPGQTRRVSKHVKDCPQCQRDLTVFSTAAAAMTDSAVMAAPPPTPESPRAEPPAPARSVDHPVPSQPERDVPRPAISTPRSEAALPRERVPRPAVPASSPGWLLPLAAVSVVLAVAIGVLAVANGRRLAGLTTQAASQEERIAAQLAQQEQLMAIVVNPGAKRVTLAGAGMRNVQFVYDAATRQGALIVRAMTDPGEGLVYQVWLVGGSTVQSVGVFRPVPGRSLVLPVTADFSRFKTIGITVEGAPDGAPQPTRTPILSASL
jgi:anti-sigma factor RsiW